MASNYDCIVLGGGPAGSTAAALVAAAGWRVLVVDQERLPRRAAGETLLGEASATLARLGVREWLSDKRCCRTVGVRFTGPGGDACAEFRAQDANAGAAALAWQVVRSEFDAMLRESALARGAEHRQSASATEALFDGDRAIGVRIEGPAGRIEELRSTALVDAGGGHMRLSVRAAGLEDSTRPTGRLDHRQSGERPSSVAIWTHYRGGRREHGDQGPLAMIFDSRDRFAWFWYLPLPDDIVSVGVVGAADYLLKGRARPEAAFEEELVNCPAVAERLIDAELAGEFRVARDLSYSAAQPAGNGWVLVGDALVSLDPVFSSGLLLALRSGELAADAVIDALARGDASAGGLGGWAAEFFQGVDRFSLLIDAFYRRDFSFGRFLGDFPQHRSAISALLMGRVFGTAADEALCDLAAWSRRRAGKPRGAAQAGPHPDLAR